MLLFKVGQSYAIWCTRLCPYFGLLLLYCVCINEVLSFPGNSEQSTQKQLLKIKNVQITTKGYICAHAARTEQLTKHFLFNQSIYQDLCACSRHGLVIDDKISDFSELSIRFADASIVYIQGDKYYSKI